MSGPQDSVDIETVYASASREFSQVVGVMSVSQPCSHHLSRVGCKIKPRMLNGGRAAKTAIRQRDSNRFGWGLGME